MKTNMPSALIPDSAAPIVPADLTVFYDGDCPLCRAEIGVYQCAKGSDRIAFVDVSAATGDLVAPGLDRDTALARFHVRRSDGTLASGAEGFGHMWLALPRWRWVGRFVLLPGIRQSAELAYRGFLRIRPAIQRRWRRAAR